MFGESFCFPELSGKRLAKIRLTRDQGLPVNVQRPWLCKLWLAPTLATIHYLARARRLMGATDPTRRRSCRNGKHTHKGGNGIRKPRAQWLGADRISGPKKQKSFGADRISGPKKQKSLPREDGGRLEIRASALLKRRYDWLPSGHGETVRKRGGVAAF